MKKISLGLFLVCLSIMLGFFSYDKIWASEISPSTIYPENIVDYVDLSNISAFDINNTYIAYTTDKSKVTLFEKSSRTYQNFDGFKNISKITLTNNSIVVSDQNCVKVIKIDHNNISTLINLVDIKALDIYFDGFNTYIATINQSTFKLYKYNEQFDNQENCLIQETTPTIISFEQAFLITINSKNAYIVYKNDSTTSSGKNYSTGLCKIQLSSNASTSNNIQIQDNFQANAQVIDTFFFENEEYIVTFRSDILDLFSTNNLFSASNESKQPLASIDISTSGNLDSSIFPIFQISDLQYHDGNIYLSDTQYKTIQKVSISKDQETNEHTIKSDEIILASFGFDKGRFNNISNIHIQGNTYIISDSKNDRIHILRDGKSYFINSETQSKPQAVAIDSKQNLYFSQTIDAKTQIVKYTFQNNTYIKNSKVYSEFKNTQIGNISDMCINNNDILFALDSDNQKILYLSENELIELANNSLANISISSNSQIKFIKGTNSLIVSSGNNVYLISSDGTRLDQTTISNLREITPDLNGFYAITDNNIQTYNIYNNKINYSQSDEANIINYNKFSYDIVGRRMIAFDTNRSCLVSFPFNTDYVPFNFEDFQNSTPLSSDEKIIALSISNAIIYDYPYELGNIYNVDGNTNNCISIDEFGDYYRVLFAHDNQLKCGFVRKNVCTTIARSYNYINVITTQQVVSVYKYPTLLKYNNTRLIVDTLPIGKNISLKYEFPIKLDGTNNFYLYQNGNSIGFIFGADVVLAGDKTIKNLNTENASIHLIGKDSTRLLDENLQNKLISLNDGDRIYVASYDKKAEYTKVIIKDKDSNTIEGYVLTADIQMDKLDNSKIILIIIIAVSIILLAIIVITYIILAKKKNK